MSIAIAPEQRTNRQAATSSSSPTGVTADARDDRGTNEVGIEGGRRSRLRVLASWVPSLLAFSLLAGAAWYGHEHDWRLPAFGGGELASSPLWCDSHGVPQANCIHCQAGLIEDAPKLKFCREHGVHGCVLHDPTLAEIKQTPQVTGDDFTRAAKALRSRTRRENNSLSTLPGTRVQFASVETMEKADVGVEPVVRRAIMESIPAPAEVRYDATRTAAVSPAADGTVRAVNVEIGDQVEAGEVLAIIDSEKVGRQKAELSAALSDERLRQTELSRISGAAKSGAVSKQRLLEVEGALRQAEVEVQRAARSLANYGIDVDLGRLRTLSGDVLDREIRKLGQGRFAEEAGENWIPVVAPLAGQITERTVVVGEVVDRGAVLFRIAELSRMWVDLRVRSEDASLVRLGQPVRFEGDGGESAEGAVTWISPDVDGRTRTVRVRAEVANPDGRLRNESFGTGEVVLREEPEAIVVPERAVHWDGQNMLVFVRDARFFEDDRPKFFTARSVRTGVSQDGFTEIIVGVLPGEVVATGGSDVLRAQLLKSNLGAGCTCGH